MSVFAAWSSLNLALKHKIIVVENSDRFRKAILTKTHGHEYAVMALVLCGTRFGWAVRRKRFYTIMIHHAWLTTLVAMMENIIPMFDRILTGAYTDMMIADLEPVLFEELFHELEWAKNRKNSKAHEKSISHVVQLKQPFRAVLESTNL